jgi:hypothetical protein
LTVEREKKMNFLAKTKIPEQSSSSSSSISSGVDDKAKQSAVAQLSRKSIAGGEAESTNTTTTTRRYSLNPSNSSERMTYAEFYLNMKRSGSLAVPVSQYTEKQLAGWLFSCWLSN